MNADCSPARRWIAALLSATVMLTVLSGCSSARTVRACESWVDWQRFKADHVQADGRVVDHSEADLRSTSEGQAYAMFFALVANDRATFAQVYQWSRSNLGRGGEDWLPAWLWGRNAEGNWGVLDANTASDADVWMAYALLEAARLWGVPNYQQDGLQMLQATSKRQVKDLPGLGAMLLPGEAGFEQGGLSTLNLSYLPLPVLRRLAFYDRQGPWAHMADASLKLIAEASPLGFAPDWVGLEQGAIVQAPKRDWIGSYDAIRVYLWAGMIDRADPLRARWLKATSGPINMLQAQGGLSERIDTRTGQGYGAAPAGFYAALLPYLQAHRQPHMQQRIAARVPEPSSDEAGKLPYYERTLVLFGRGFADGRWSFGAAGTLHPAWEGTCSTAN